MKVFMLSLLLLSSVAHADTASSIKKAITNNIQHTFNEDEAAVMGDMHSQSPAYASTQHMHLLRICLSSYFHSTILNMNSLGTNL